MNRTVFLILFLFLISATPVFSQKYIHKPGGDLTELSQGSIEPHEQKGAYYNEFWRYHIILDNGSQIYLTYSLTHFGGLRDAVTGARLSLLNWKGNDYDVAREYDLTKMVFDQSINKMNLNPERSIWFEGILPDEHKIVFKTNKDDILYDINIDFLNIEPGVTWGDGVFKLGSNDEVGISTSIPFSEVGGFIALNGDTTNISGKGYMVHTYQSNVGTRLFDTGFSFVEHHDDGASSGLFFIPKDSKSEVVGYILEETNGKIVLKKPTSIKILSRKKYLGETIPDLIEICFESSPCENISISKIQEKVAMLDELSGLKKMVAKRFLGGDLIEFRGTALRNGTKSVYYSLTVLD